MIFLGFVEHSEKYCQVFFNVMENESIVSPTASIVLELEFMARSNTLIINRLVDRSIRNGSVIRNMYIYVDRKAFSTGSIVMQRVYYC